MRKLQRWVMLHRIPTFIILAIIYTTGAFSLNDLISIPPWILGIALFILYLLSAFSRIVAYILRKIHRWSVMDIR